LTDERIWSTNNRLPIGSDNFAPIQPMGFLCRFLGRHLLSLRINSEPVSKKTNQKPLESLSVVCYYMLKYYSKSKNWTNLNSVIAARESHEKRTDEMRTLADSVEQFDNNRMRIAWEEDRWEESISGQCWTCVEHVFTCLLRFSAPLFSKPSIDYQANFIVAFIACQ
jgi:hypothetical protein